MRKEILAVLLSLIAVTAEAGSRSLRQMKEIAKEQLATAVATRAADDLKLETLFENETLVLIGDTTAGFAVVTRDDGQVPVVGISQSPFSLSDMPEAFRWWLATVNENLLQGVRPATRSMAGVPNFVNTQWEQGSPYNGMCPKELLATCPTGCVATAMGQIMRYFSYPAKGKGTGSYTVGSGLLKHTGAINNTYEWQKMLASYGNSSGSSNKQAVQELMYDCGLAVNMHYEKDASSAFSYDAAIAFFKHFSYDSLAVRYYSRDFFSDEEWTDMVYHELALKRPILYSGYDSGKKSGHAFLLTGNDEEGKVWVNWGWGRKSNGESYDGFFSLDAMTLGSSYNFNSVQDMVIGLRPQEKPDAQDELTSLWTSDKPYRLTAAGKNAVEFSISSYYNAHILYFKGQLLYRFRRLSDNRTEFFTMMDLSKSSIAPFYGFSPNKGNYQRETIDIETLQPGSYEFCVVSKADGQGVPSEMLTQGGPCYFYLTKEADGTVSIIGQETAISRTRQERTAPDGKTYDLRGRMQESGKSLPAGIYVRDGRKIVIK